MKRLGSKLTYANVMATVAVFLALGGGAYAATQLKKNSVGTKQLKKNSVTTAKIKKGAVTGAKVKLSSLGTVPNASHASSADTATALAPPEAVHIVGAAGEPAFENGAHDEVTTETGAATFWKDHECVVHLAGAVIGQSGKSAFTLPPGFRPAQPVVQQLLSNNPPGGTLISPDGTLVLFLGGTGLVALDGFTFRAANC